MSDQSVRITNLPDSGSPERVAFDILKWTQNTGDKPTTRDAWLREYVKCLEAVRGFAPK